MADCYLTEKQKELLRTLVPGLQNGSVEAEWTIVTGDDQVIGIFGLEDSELWNNHWQNISEADFDAFVDCGYFRFKGIGRYTLNAQKITSAVEDHFGENIATQTQLKQDGTITVTPIFGPPITTKQFQCDVFMVMPFREPFQTIYNDHIKPLVESLNIEIKLGDNFFSKHEIMTEIWSAIYNSKLLIADCTGKNPNVFYELGIAHTLGRPAIMITQNIDDIPFDVRGKRAIVYEYTPRGMKELEIKLKAAIENLLNDGEG